MDAYFTPQELAKLLRIHVQTLQKFRTRGTGPAFIQVGTAIRYPRAAVDQWLTERQRTITAESNRGRRPAA